MAVSIKQGAVIIGVTSPGNCALHSKPATHPFDTFGLALFVIKFLLFIHNGPNIAKSAPYKKGRPKLFESSLPYFTKSSNFS